MTPFSVSLGHDIHKQTQSKKVIDTLSKLTLTILEIKTAIANKISKYTDNSYRTFVPPNINFNTPIHFPIGNVAFP